MTFHSKLMYSSVTLLALTACGGGGTDDGSGLIEPGEVRFFAEGGQTFDGLISAGGTELVAREVSEASWIERYGSNPDGEGYDTVDGTISFEGAGDDLLVTFGPEGDTTTITIPNAANRNVGQYRVSVPGDDGYYFDLFINRIDFADLFDETNDINGVITGLYYASNSDTFGFQTRGVIGLETTDTDLAELGADSATATYFGGATIEIRQADAGFNTINANLNGSLTMDADFAAGTIGGVMDDLSLQVREGRTFDPVTEEPTGWTSTETTGPLGTLIFEETTFTDNAFAGDVVPDATLIADSPEAAAFGSVTYEGAFYREGAGSASGTLSGAASVDGTDYLAIGSFGTALPLP